VGATLDCGHYVAFVKQRKPVDVSAFLQQKFIDRQALSEKQQFVEFARRCASALRTEGQKSDDATGTWYKIDDEKVYECRRGEEERQSAYLLFYERVQ